MIATKNQKLLLEELIRLGSTFFPSFFKMKKLGHCPDNMAHLNSKQLDLWKQNLCLYKLKALMKGMNSPLEIVHGVYILWINRALISKTVTLGLSTRFTVTFTF